MKWPRQAPTCTVVFTVRQGMPTRTSVRGSMSEHAIQYALVTLAKAYMEAEEDIEVLIKDPRFRIDLTIEN